MKKVLIFSLAYYPHVGGAEVAIKEITDRIAPEDIEFHMVTMRFSSADAKEEKIRNVTVHRIGRGAGKFSKLYYQFAAARKGLALHRVQKFDAIWAMMAHSSGVPAAIFKRRQPSVPYVLTLQEGDPPEVIERIMRPLWRLFSRAFTSADMVQTISNFLADWARRRGFKGPLEVIPNGVNVQSFLGSPVPHEGVVLITTSRLVHKNALDVVIRALALLPEARFKILGIGPEQSALQALAQEKGVADRVEFVGFVEGEKIPAYLHAADIFIRPSRSEGMGNSFIEAMAAGVPVIATQEGGLKDFISSETAWPVRTDSEEDIAAAVKAILSNPEATKKVVEYARKLAVERYDWNLISRDMREKVFARLFV